jgi:hypothetical protein
MPSTGLQHPALAAVAARAASAGSSAVLFDVTHFGAAPPSGTDLAANAVPTTDVTPPTAKDRVATETLAFEVAGMGFQLHTWAPATPSKQLDAVSNRRISVSPHESDHSGSYRQLFSGSVVINPRFLYDAARSTELLLTLDSAPWQPDYADSLMIAHAYRGMLDATTPKQDRVGVPVLSLQSPVAPFRDPPRRFRADGSGEAPRVPRGMALRMLVGFDVTSWHRRIELVCEIAAFAAEHGFGLQVADRRFGRVRGEWWSVLPPDQQRYAERKQALFGWAPGGVPAAAQLLTFVGPARVGSSAAIAADLLARNVGILAVSEVSLQEVAFVNLAVPIAPARLDRTGTAETAETSTGTCHPITAGIGRTASACGLTRRRGVRARSTIGDSAAADYRVLTTGPVRPRIEDAVRESDYPVWLSWEIPLEPDPALRPDVAELILAQLKERAGPVTGGQIDYYRVQVAPGGRVTGRAKITISLVGGIARRDVPSLLSELCPLAEREVAARLVRDDLPRSAIRVRLAWRERWLGRSTTLA